MTQYDGNLAFKCTWNDAGFKGICSQSAYEYNISKGRAWCKRAPCRTFEGRPTAKNHPCYESIIFAEWRFGAGWDHKTVERPRKILKAKVGKIALLTTLEPNKEEKERKIVGFLKINRIEHGHKQETVIHGDSGKSLEIDPGINVKFWDYYRNPSALKRRVWATGLFRYIDDKAILKLLHDLKKAYMDRNLSQDDILRMDENISDYEKIKPLPPERTKKICPHCGHKNLDQAKFCNKCGKDLGVECEKCHTVNPVGSNYCFACGNNLTASFQGNPIAIRDRLLAFGRHQLNKPRSWMFTPNLEADRFVQQNQNAFLFAVILDQGIDAEKAWAAPYELKKRIGHLDPKLIADFTEQEIEAFFKEDFKLHRFWPTMARRIKVASDLIENKYHGNAKNIWSDGVPSRELYESLVEFDGIGQKKASMTVNILFRDLGVEIRDKSGIDVSYDVMVRRTFRRTGLIKDDTLKNVVGAARRLNPEYPGELDYPAWLIGRKWCLPTNPRCSECPLIDVCPKIKT